MASTKKSPFQTRPIGTLGSHLCKPEPPTMTSGTLSIQIWLISSLPLVKPTELVFHIPDDDRLFDRNAYEAYEARKDVYKGKLAQYEHQNKAFGDLISFTQATIAAHNVTFIQKEDPHPWNILSALKRHPAPSDEARTLEMEQKYHKLCQGPGTRNFETWFDKMDCDLFYRPAEVRWPVAVFSFIPFRASMLHAAPSFHSEPAGSMLAAGRRRGQRQWAIDSHLISLSLLHRTFIHEIDHSFHLIQFCCA